MPKGQAPTRIFVKLDKKTGQIKCIGKTIDLETLIEVANVSIDAYLTDMGRLPFSLVDDQ